MLRKKKLLVLLIGVVVFVLSFPASAKIVFNIDIQPETYGFAYEGDQNAVYDDGVNTWYVQAVDTNHDWNSGAPDYPYSYNHRVWPSEGKPAGANTGLRIMFGWNTASFNLVPNGFDYDPNYNGLMTDGANTPPALSQAYFCRLSFYGDSRNQGVYDVYAYSNDYTGFRLWYAGAPEALNRQTSGYPGGWGAWDENSPTFIENQNYVKWEDFSFDSASDPLYRWPALDFNTPDDACEGNFGSLSAVQLVYLGIPIEIDEPNGVTVDPTWYTFAHDYDSWRGAFTATHQVAWCQQDEWLDYHIFAIDDANEGYYDVYVGLESPFTDANCGASLDGGPVHEVSAFSDPEVPWDGNTVDMFVHRWKITTEGNVLRLDVLTESPFNIWGINFQWAADQNDYCADLQERGETLAMDFNGDCIVNPRDLQEFVDKWLNCNDPAGCP